ncbi:hypothetical protein [Pararhodospirillum oryzae]|uniref:Glutamine amidotransferase domain-containing protein n=1 Tax=Pararhodospirillum oryzae TaxID=478448 RepID=A0A512H8V6_9PROT|nr:hypothetical protein [Pararhodospirillum oryzae]GEO81886.1 hypothetical protein ROR02_20170 [Pararhodospirillum oryzae]
METLTGLSLAPLLPYWVVLPLAGVAGGLVVYALARRARGALQRLVALGALTGVLLNPQWVTETREPLSDVAVVVVDASPSQALTGRLPAVEASAHALTEALGRLPGLETRVVRVEGQDGETRLMGTLNEALADVPRDRRAGVIVLSDGQIHDSVTTDVGAPVHVVLTGPREGRDRVVLVGDAPGFGLVGKPVRLSVTVEDGGVSPGTPVPLRVALNGKTTAERLVPANQPAGVDVVLDTAGPNVIELETPVVSGEIAAINNRAALMLNGVRDRLRVLLLSGQPHVGERVWRNLLKADPAVDLVHFTILRPPMKEDLTPLSELALIAFPIQELFEERVGEFDLIVFDRFVRWGLVPDVYLANVAAAVRRGGAVLFSVGPEDTLPDTLANSPLAEILPARPSGRLIETPFVPTLTGEGRRHPVTAGLPGAGVDGAPPTWGPWGRLVEQQDARGRIVMTGAQGLPLLVLSKAGEGRVALLASDTVWLWAKGWQGGGPQGELLRRLAHWLMREPELEEESLRARIENGRLLVSRRTMETLPETVRVEPPGEPARSLSLHETQPGVGEAEMAAPVPGVYRVEAGEGFLALAVSGPPNPPETTRLLPTEARLAPLARESGGAMLWLEPGGRLPTPHRVPPGQPAHGPGWIGLVAQGRHVVSGVTLTPVFGGPLAFVLILGGLAAAWFREGHASRPREGDPNRG